jgi:hypothetical protein
VYAGTLAGEEKCVVTVQGVVTALAPIAHGEPESNRKRAAERNGEENRKWPERPVRKVALFWRGSFLEVPVVSSNHIVHLCRALLVRDMLRKAGVTDQELEGLRAKQPAFYQTLFSGGALEGQAAEDGDAQDAGNGGRGRARERARRDPRYERLNGVLDSPEKLAEAFPVVKLFGCAVPWLGDVILESCIGVGHMWPLTIETADLFGLTAEDLRKLGAEGQLIQAVQLSQVDHMVFVRTDETADVRAEGEESARNVFEVEYVPAGTRFYHEIHVDAREKRFGLAALKRLAEDLLPQHPFVGGLIKRGFGRVGFAYRLPEGADKAEYDRRVNPDRIREVVNALLA